MKVEREDFTKAALARIEKIGSMPDRGGYEQGVYDVYRELWLALPAAPFEVGTGMRIQHAEGTWEFEVGYVPYTVGDDTNLPARYTEYRGGDASHKLAFFTTAADIRTMIQSGSWVVGSA